MSVYRTPKVNQHWKSYREVLKTQNKTYSADVWSC
nr:MAG TPA: protein kinase [Caudoviricetes sp.]